ncbi:MAG: anti-sigma factor antagonist [Eubacteriales bacterium]
MQEDFKVIQEYLMVRLPEEIDHHKTNYISKEADHYIIRGKVKDIVFDFEDTKFMDSSGIGLIMGRYKKIICFGGKIYALHADKQIRKILSMAGLKKYIEILEEE